MSEVVRVVTEGGDYYLCFAYKNDIAIIENISINGKKVRIGLESYLPYFSRLADMKLYKSMSNSEKLNYVKGIYEDYMIVYGKDNIGDEVEEFMLDE